MAARPVGRVLDNFKAELSLTEPAVQLGPVKVWTPVLLAPMAGVTDLPFRRLCRQMGESVLPEQVLRRGEDTLNAPSGLYLMEMVTARALVAQNQQTWKMLQPDPQERVKSVQLYGVNPSVMAQSAKMMVQAGLVDHLDMNFGCPVPKVTRKGGGAALPWKRDLFEEIVDQVVRTVDRFAPDGPGSIPVTVKMRVGIDDDHHTAEEAGLIAQNAGVSAVTLHARTQQEYYSGHSDWTQIARLKETLKIPVFGNGDVFSGQDALQMMQETGCDAVVVGRGCQGRPWIFAEAAAALWDVPVPPPPSLQQVTEVILDHAQLMIEYHQDELRAMREMRKHVAWYLRGFAVGGTNRRDLSLVSTYSQLQEQLAQLDLSQPFPPRAAGKRGRAGKSKKPHLPYGWLDSRNITEQEKQELHLAEDGGSGG